jgi:hypothetical protein
VSSTFHERETVRGWLGRHSPWTNLTTAETAGQRRASGTDSSVASDSGSNAVGMGRGEARGFQTAGWNAACRNGAVRTPARGPDSAFNALERRGAWQPHGNGGLPGGPGVDSGV